MPTLASSSQFKFDKVCQPPYNLYMRASRIEYWADRRNRLRFGGQRLIVLERDKYKCVDCGMTQDEHIAQYRKSLTINHINGKGRRSAEPDNRLENLETLCLRCHGLKDCQNAKWVAKSSGVEFIEV